MDIDYLRWFLRVAEGGTVTDTASAAFITQSAMSRALRRLENEVGASLLFRSGRILTPTPAGRLFVEYARSIVRTHDEAMRAVADLVEPDAGTVPLAFLHTFGTWFVPQLLRDFGADHPRTRFDLEQHGESGLRKRLLNGAVDMVLTSADPDPSRTEWRPLMVESLALAVPPDHPLAAQPSVKLADLADEPFIVLRKGFGLRQLTDRLCLDSGFAPRIGFEGEEVETLRGFVSAGLGVAILPHAPASSLRYPTPMLELTDVRAERSIGIAWLSERTLPAPSERFRDFVIDEARRIVKR